MITDWELGQLYRKMIRGPEWKSKIKEKIMEEIFGKNRDTYIILGNMVSHPQTFCVLGFFGHSKTLIGKCICSVKGEQYV
jgi:hypothetical protein